MCRYKYTINYHAIDATVFVRNTSNSIATLWGQVAWDFLSKKRSGDWQETTRPSSTAAGLRQVQADGGWGGGDCYVFSSVFTVPRDTRGCSGALCVDYTPVRSLGMKASGLGGGGRIQGFAWGFLRRECLQGSRAPGLREPAGVGPGRRARKGKVQSSPGPLPLPSFLTHPMPLVLSRRSVLSSSSHACHIIYFSYFYFLLYFYFFSYHFTIFLFPLTKSCLPTFLKF